jgi:HSP20 family protein
MNVMPTLTRRRQDGAPSMAQDIMRLDEPFQRLWRQFPLLEWQSESMDWTPRLDLIEKEDAFVLTAEIPGVEPKDVEVSIEGNVLTVKGEKRSAHDEKGERYQMSERSYGMFERSLNLPRAANPDEIRAQHAHGVLQIEIGKRPETRGRKIQVKAGS